jgi:hypothetical protein
MSRAKKNPWTIFDDVITIELKFYGSYDECDAWKLKIRNSIKDMTKGQHKWFVSTPARRYIYDRGRIDQVEWSCKAQFIDKEIATLFKLTWC